MNSERAKAIRELLDDIEPTQADPSYAIRILKSAVTAITNELEKEDQNG